MTGFAAVAGVAWLLVAVAVGCVLWLLAAAACPPRRQVPKGEDGEFVGIPVVDPNDVKDEL